MEPSVWFPQNIWKNFPYKKLNLFKKSSIATLPPDIKHSTHIKNVDKPKQQYWYNFNKSLGSPHQCKGLGIEHLESLYTTI